MSNQNISSNDVLDAVEEKLDLNGARSQEAIDGASIENSTCDGQVKKQTSLISRIIFKIKCINFDIMRDKICLDNRRKEKIKSFSTSNLGITLIVLLVVVFFIGINVIRRHHASSSVSSSSPKWSSSVIKKNKPVVVNKSLVEKVVPSVNSITMSHSVTSIQIKNMMQILHDLSNQMKSLDQRMMVISQQLTKRSHHTIINKHYRVLGWRLDQDTNQWIADIQYNGQVKAYYSGQHFGKWTVRNVTANGVEIH